MLFFILFILTGLFVWLFAMYFVITVFRNTGIVGKVCLGVVMVTLVLSPWIFRKYWVLVACIAGNIIVGILCFVYIKYKGL